MEHHTITLGAAILLLTVGLAPATIADESDGPLVVCEDPEATSGCTYDHIQNAVEDAEEGDTIEILAGFYQQSVTVYEPDGITIEGQGPGATIIDGTGVDGGEGLVYIAGADGVTVRDLTVQNYEDGYGIYFSQVTGFHVDNAEALDNFHYGIYADQSTDGVFEDSYATGHGDAGFYLGDVEECNCVIRDVVSEGNLLGYSGTSSSHIEILDSEFRNNAAGIVPNILDVGEDEPSNMRVEGNLIADNNNHAMTEAYQVAGFYVPAGFGVINAGGNDNVWKDNTFVNHERAGFAQTWLFNEPSFNEITGNTFITDTEDFEPHQPGPTDVFQEAPVDILWDGGGVLNCFEANVQGDGDPITFDAGTVWNAAGTLPDCQTPNAGAPDPTSLARQVSLMFTNCEPAEHAEGDGPSLNEDCDYSTLDPR